MCRLSAELLLTIAAISIDSVVGQFRTNEYEEIDKPVAISVCVIVFALISIILCSHLKLVCFKKQRHESQTVRDMPLRPLYLLSQPAQHYVDTDQLSLARRLGMSTDDVASAQQSGELPPLEPPPKYFTPKAARQVTILQVDEPLPPSYDQIHFTSPSSPNATLPPYAPSPMLAYPVTTIDNIAECMV